MKSTVYIETFGCQMNVADTERAAGRLRAANYQLVDSPAEADVVLFNTCSVREKAAQKVFRRIHEVRSGAPIGRRAPLIGVMGCVAQLEGEALFDGAPKVDLVVGTRATDRLPQLIEEARTSGGGIVDLDERRANERWEVASCDRRSPYVTYVPIIEGCNKFCSYCIVPFSRGREKSRPAREILEELSALKRAGYSEVHLIGQNVNSYRPKVEDGLEGVRGATAFSRLLRAAAATTGLPRIKFTTSFPRDFHEDIVRALEEHENLCNWVHLPVQSGSDRVLRLMRRGYKVADYMQRVEWIKGARRNLSLTSDVIVGFPGETAEEFDMTMDLVEQCQYDGLYIFKYSKRSGTPAAKIPSEVSKTEMTGRFLRLEALQRTVQRKIYELYRGAVVSVLVEGLSAKSSSDWSGHTTCHKVVNFPSSGSDLAGKIVQVRVTAAKKNSLYGEQIIDWD